MLQVKPPLFPALKMLILDPCSSCSPCSSGSKVGSWIFRFYKVVPPRLRSVGEHNSNVTMVYGTQITIVFMGFINQQTSLGGPTLYECLGTSWTLGFPPLDPTSTVMSQRRLRCSDARGCASVASFQPWCGHLQGNREVLPAGSEGKSQKGGFCSKSSSKKSILGGLGSWQDIILIHPPGKKHIKKD